MKKALIALAMLLSMGAPSYAQSTASPVVPGYLTTSGCTPATATPCFVQYGSGGTSPTSDVTVVGPLHAGTNIIGKVGIDQTTPGTTNGVQTLSGSTTAVTQTTASNLNATVVETPSTYVSTTALAANQIIVTGAHKLLSFQVTADTTLSGAAWWLMIYDATTAPGDGAITPAKCIGFPSGTTAYTGAYFSPVPFTTGIVIGVSTTGCFTKTASTHAFISGDYQ